MVSIFVTHIRYFNHQIDKCVGHVEHTIEMILKMNSDSLVTMPSPNVFSAVTSAEAHVSAVASRSNHVEQKRPQVKAPLSLSHLFEC